MNSVTTILVDDLNVLVKTSICVLVLCLFFSSIRSSFAGPDDLQIGLSSAQPLQLRWYNVEGGDEWLSSNKPVRYNGVHRLTLQQGEEVYFIVPPSAMLRLTSESEQALNDSVSVEQSGDGRVFARRELRWLEQGQSWLLDKYDDESSIIRLTGTAASAVHFAIYYSSQSEPGKLANYRSQLKLDVDTVLVSSLPGTGSQFFYPVASSVPQEVTIDGPAYIEIQMRRVYDESIPAAGDALLHIDMDAKPYKKLYFEYSPDTKHINRVAGFRQSLSAVAAQYLFVPEGKHRLTLHSYSDVLLRLLIQDENDYFSFESNKPSWLDDDMAVSTEKEWRDALASNTDTLKASLSDEYRSIQRVARNNQLVDSGLAAIRRLENLAINNSGQAVFEKLLAKNISRHGRFSDLQPEAKGLMQQHVYRSSSRRLLRPGEINTVIMDEKHTDFYINSLMQGTFYSLANSEKINYQLPVQNQDSYLRIVLLTDAEQQAEDLVIELDNGDRFYLNRVADQFDESLFKATVTSRMIADKCCDEKLYRHDQSQIKEAGVIVLPIDRAIRSFSVTTDGNSALSIAAQIYQSKNSQLDEESYISHIHQSHTAAEDFRQWLLAHRIQADQRHDFKPIETASVLQNDWLVRIKSYAEKYQNYIEGLDIEHALYTAQDIYSQDRLQELQLKASAMEADKQWLLAFDHWLLIVKHSDGDSQRHALFKMIDTMKYLGQSVLSETLLRALALQNKDSKVQSQAISILLQHYTSRDDQRHITALYLSLFVYSGDIQWLPGLISSLVEQGEWKMSLQLTHLIAEDQWPHQSVLLAAGGANWWKTFHRALPYLSPQQKLLWQGHEQFFFGDYTKALEYYQDAGDAGKVWSEFSNKMITSMQQFDDFPHTDQADLVDQWYSLIAESPSEKIWQRADWAISNHAGALVLINTIHNKRSLAYLSRPDAAVELEIMGPVDLRLGVRPLFERTQQPIAKDSWYQVVINGQAIDFPITASVPATAIRIDGRDTRPANKVVSEYKLAAGLHKVSVSSSEDIIVTAQVAEAVMRLPGFPRTSSESVKAKPVAGAEKIVPSFIVAETSAIRSMIEYLQQSELEPNNNREILAKAEALYANNQQQVGLKSLLSRIGRSAKWQSFDNITTSAGVRQLESHRWQAESPAKRMYAALFSEANPDRRVISSGEGIGISVFNKEKTTLSIDAEVVMPWFINRQPVYLYYQLDNGIKNKVKITQHGRVAIEVPRGSHYINISLAKLALKQSVALQLTEQDGRAVVQKYRRSYHIATHDEPIEFTINGPAWIRIDRLLDGVVSSDYRYIENSGHAINIKPEDDQQDVLVRIFRRIPGTVRKQVELEWDDTETVVANADYLALDKVAEKTRLLDQLPLAGQEDGTLSYTSSLVKRRSIEDEDLSETDEFLELSAAYRYFQAADDVRYQANFLYRLRGENPDSLGIKARAYGHTGRYALNWELRASLFTQQLEKSTAIGSRLNLTIKQYRHYQLRSYHVPKFNLFVRSHKLDYLEDEFIDSDIFTDYKNHHLYGIRLSDTLVYQPYLDVAYYAGARLTTNEEFTDLDNHNFNLGWRQLLGEYTLGAKFNNTSYHQDNDRSQDYSKSTVSVDMGWNRWRSNRHRLQISLLYRHDFEIDDNSVRLNFHYHTGTGRDYRDFARDGVIFRKLKENRLPIEPNNEIY